MATYNRVILVGNLTKDPELRYTSGGLAVSNFSLAINRKFTSGGEKKEEVDYFDIEAWDKLAELCSEYLKKGSGVLIEGRLKQDRWEDETGSKRSRIKIVATAIQFLPKGGDSGKDKGNDDTGRADDRPDDHAPF